MTSWIRALLWPTFLGWLIAFGVSIATYGGLAGAYIAYNNWLKEYMARVCDSGPIQEQYYEACTHHYSGGPGDLDERWHNQRVH